MTTTTTPLPWAQRFALNAENKLKSGSFWFAGVLAAVLGAFVAWPDAAKSLEVIPIFKGLGLPLVGLIGILATMLRPTAGLSSQSQLLAQELIRTKWNEWNRAHGLAEIPAPATPVPLPPTAVLPPPLPAVPAPAQAPASAPVPLAPPPPPAPPPPAPPAPPPPAEPALERSMPAMPPSLASMPDTDAIMALREVEPLASDDGVVLALKVLRLNRRAIDFDTSKP